MKKAYITPNISIVNVELEYNPICSSPSDWHNNPGHGGEHGNGNNHGNHYGWGKHNLGNENEVEVQNNLW